MKNTRTNRVTADQLYSKAFGRLDTVRLGIQALRKKMTSSAEGTATCGAPVPDLDPDETPTAECTVPRKRPRTVSDDFREALADLLTL